MRAARRKGLSYSAAFHVLLFVLVVFGLPHMAPPPPEEPSAISVEILPITSVSNVKPSDAAPAQEEKTEPPKPAPAKPTPAAKAAVAAPPPPPPPVPKKEEKKPEPKKEEKKPEPAKEEKKKPKEADLAAVLNAVKDRADKEKKEAEKEKADSDTKTKSRSTSYNADQQLSLSEKDAIMSQIEKCWTIPAGAKNAQALTVVVGVEFNPDGSYTHVGLSDENMQRYNSDSFYRAAADAAIRAVRECSPLKGMPQEKYQTWRSTDLYFDPSKMIN